MVYTIASFTMGSYLQKIGTKSALRLGMLLIVLDLLSLGLLHFVLTKGVFVFTALVA